jgi:hypothetical protein
LGLFDADLNGPLLVVAEFLCWLWWFILL